MDLVPRCHVNSQFQKRFEQLYREISVSPSRTGNYKDLCPVLHKYCKVTDQLLVVGCGEDGSFFEELFDAGYHSVTSVDGSSSTDDEIHTLKAGLNSDFFNVVLDRGVIDGRFKDQPTNSNVMKYFEGIQTLLKVGGRYLCLTYAPADILDRLLDYFSLGWFFRVHWLHVYLEVSYKRPALLPLFLFVLTKTTFAGSSNRSVSVLEMCLSGIEHIFRVKSLLEVKSSVQEIQQYFIMKKSLERISPGLHVNIDLFPPVANEHGKLEHRYSMTAVDIPKKSATNKVFAIFIVPQGRETEWLFASDEGQKELADNAGFDRLVIATLGRGHAFSDISTIKKELSAKVMEIAPIGLSCDAQVPFLSIGDDIGNRVVLHEGNSTFSGNYVVEDVDDESGMRFRRLIFLSNKNAIQSEAKLVVVTGVSNTRGKKNRGKQKNKSGSSIKCRVDHGYLACQHHRIIVTGLAWVEGFLKTGGCETKRCLLVGLGGGGLPMFLHQHFRQLSLEVVELDPSISEIAKCWFEFKEDERMKVIIEDGLVFVKAKESKPSYHVIIFDLDSKDTSVGMSSPPESFVDKTFLAQVQSLLHPSGVFILNLVCRNASLKKRVVADLHTVFCELYSIGIEGEVNEVVIALPQRRYQTQADGKNSADVVKNSLRDSIKKLQRCAKTEATCWDSSLDLCKLAEGLEII